ncbi:MAG: HlyD family secretion protein [Anaerolineales bacterium]
MKTRFPAILMLLMIAVLTLSGCSPAAAAQPAATPISPVSDPEGTKAEGRLEPVRYAELALSADGSISELLAKEGDTVTAGQVIAQIQNAQSETLESAQASASKRLADAYQAVRDAQNKLDNFDIPAQFAGMSAAKGTETALANLNTARDAFEPYKDSSVQGYRANHSYPWLPAHILVDTQYYKGGLAKEYKKKLDNAWVDYRRAVQWLEMDSALQAAQAQLALAQKDSDSLQDSTFAEDTAGARAALASAELRAPFSGTITNMDLKAGQFTAAGTPIVTIGDFSSWVVKTTDLTEIDVVNIKEGEPVTMTLDAIPGATLKGTVLSIAENYTERQGDIVYKVTILLSDTNPAMRWGMTAKVNFAGK